MGFIEKNLANNEKIVYRGNLHWWIYVKNILLIVLGIIIGVAAGNSEGAKAVGGIIVFLALLGLIGAFIRNSSTEFVVTNRRVILKTGVLKRKLIELQLTRAEGLRVDQGIIGRIFNYGSIIVTSGNVTESFAPVAQPYEFKKQVNNAIEDALVPIKNQAFI